MSELKSSTSYRLRRAVAADAAIITAWFPTHASAVLWGGPEVPDVLSADWLARQFEDRLRRYHVLVDEEDGVCATYVLRSFLEEQRLHIGRFAVAPNLRGQGLGLSMLTMAQDFARAESAEKLTLYVYDSNVEARKLYERVGFRDTGSVFWDDRSKEVMALMECAVPEHAHHAIRE